MSENAERIPFPCHPKGCWVLSDAGLPSIVYQRCCVCGELYEIDIVKGTMQHMVPANRPSQRARLLFDKVNEILDDGCDAVLRRTTGGEIKCVGQKGFNKGNI